jgi:hypothetical protein
MPCALERRPEALLARRLPHIFLPHIFMAE